MGETDEKKILVMGLDDSGKTSIVLSLKGERNLLSFYSLKPTPGRRIEEITTGSTQFHVWELGGQLAYRVIVPTEDFFPYMEDVGRVIYVIDVQAADRYSEAIEYFEQILTQFRKRRQISEVSIFLHKFDPSLENAERFTDAILDRDLVKKLTALASPDFSLTVHKTTIYTVFRKTRFTPL